MLDPVVRQARNWGFTCQYQESKSWLILPQQPNQKWQLQQAEDQWILLVGSIPQLRLHRPILLVLRWLKLWQRIS